MTVIYRLCGIKSSNESPIYQDDKFKLNELCLKSFVKAFQKVNPKVVILADYCDDRYPEMIKRVLPFKYDYLPLNLGINGTCLKQYELAEKIDDDLFFLECDYLWRPDTGEKFVEAVKTLKLVSPYDHLNFYIDRSIHSKVVELELVSDTHFRTTERQTMTFGMTKETFEQNKHILNKWGYLDNEVWKEMLHNGYPLYVPIPSFATHMVKNWLAPSVDWSKIWTENI